MLGLYQSHLSLVKVPIPGFHRIPNTLGGGERRDLPGSETDAWNENPVMQLERFLHIFLHFLTSLHASPTVPALGPAGSILPSSGLYHRPRRFHGYVPLSGNREWVQWELPCTSYTPGRSEHWWRSFPLPERGLHPAALSMTARSSSSNGRKFCL